MPLAAIGKTPCPLGPVLRFDVRPRRNPIAPADAESTWNIVDGTAPWLQNRMTRTKSCKGIAQSIRQSAGKRKGRRKLPKETRPAPMANFPVQEFLRLYKSMAPGPQANAIGPMRRSDPLEGRMHLGMHLASLQSVEDRYVEAEANRAIRHSKVGHNRQAAVLSQVPCA